MASSAAKRLNVRLDAGSKELIERAAHSLNQTVSSFTISTLIREARQVVGQSEALRLSDRDRQIFLDALDNPPAPNAKLRAAAREHAARVAK